MEEYDHNSDLIGKMDSLVEEMEEMEEKEEKEEKENIQSKISISENIGDYHYLCPNCCIFPFIEFDESRNIIKCTCSCYNNKEISINNFLDINKKYITNLSNEKFLSSSDPCYKGLKCKEHNYHFKYFCKTCLLNICEKCEYDHNYAPHELILLESILNNNKQFKKLNELVNKKEPNNDDYLRRVSEDEDSEFYKLIRIILNDYKVYPNFSHILNIKNLIHFFNLSDDYNSRNYINGFINRLSNEKDEIIIKYSNNNSNINLVNEKFVEKNKNKVYLEINGTIHELKAMHKFENNEKIVTIKLIIKENIFEIDMSEMFSNCYNLISINGISKWKKTKIINKYKMFYNCTSLSSIIDIDDWRISTDISYLMFYNCISLIFFPNAAIEKILLSDIKNNTIDLGILITKYLQNGKEILFKAMVKNNEKTIILNGNKLLYFRYFF